jgi:membrane protein required for colicin V production
MNLLDILIWAVLLIFMVKGLMKGLIREVCSLSGLVMGSWAAFKYYPFLSAVIWRYIHLPNYVSSVISFIVIFLAIGLLFFFLGRLLTEIFKIILLGGINRVGGLIFGFLQGSLVLCLLLFLGTTTPMPLKLKSELEKSKTARPFIFCGREIIYGWDSGMKKAGASSGSHK